MSCKVLILIICLVTSSAVAEAQEVRLYAYGHSLVDHRPPRVPTPSDQTTIIHWINDIAKAAGKNFSATGQYGFLPSHAAAPPKSQWGYQDVARSWDEEVEDYATADITTVLMTAANFIQYEAPSAPHPIDPSTSVVEATETIIDWTEAQKPETRYYVYAHWPEMDLRSEYPPTVPDADEIAHFHASTRGDFASWWIDYHDDLLTSRPDLAVKLIPAGAIMSEIITDILGENVPFEELYEDSAPHGRASLYFLSGMISYMCIYQENIPADYRPDDTVHPYICQELSRIRQLAWSRLADYADDNGGSRVFFSSSTSTVDISSTPIDLEIMRTGDGLYQLTSSSTLQGWSALTMSGVLLYSSRLASSTYRIDLSSVSKGLYLIVAHDRDGQDQVRKVVR